MNPNFAFPAPPAPVLRPTKYAHQASPPPLAASTPPFNAALDETAPGSRDSNALRASVLDAALLLGVGAGSAVAGWIFNDPITEEDEEDLSPASPSKSFPTRPTNEEQVLSQVTPSLPFNATGPFNAVPVGPQPSLNAQPERENKKAAGNKLKKDKDLEKAEEKQRVKEEKERLKLEKERKKKEEKEAKSARKADGGGGLESEGAFPSESSNLVKKSKSSKAAGNDGFETDASLGKGSKSKKGLGFFGLRSKASKSELTANAEPSQPPHLPPMPLPISAKFATAERSPTNSNASAEHSLASARPIKRQDTMNSQESSSQESSVPSLSSVTSLASSAFVVTPQLSRQASFEISGSPPSSPPLRYRNGTMFTTSDNRKGMPPSKLTIPSATRKPERLTSLSPPTSTDQQASPSIVITSAVGSKISGSPILSLPSPTSPPGTIRRVSYSPSRSPTQVTYFDVPPQTPPPSTPLPTPPQSQLSPQIKLAREIASSALRSADSESTPQNPPAARGRQAPFPAIAQRPFRELPESKIKVRMSKVERYQNIKDRGPKRRGIVGSQTSLSSEEILDEGHGIRDVLDRYANAEDVDDHFSPYSPPLSSSIHIHEEQDDEPWQDTVSSSDHHVALEDDVVISPATISIYNDNYRSQLNPSYPSRIPAKDLAAGDGYGRNTTYTTFLEAESIASKGYPLVMGTNAYDRGTVYTTLSEAEMRESKFWDEAHQESYILAAEESEKTRGKLVSRVNAMLTSERRRM